MPVTASNVRPLSGGSADGRNIKIAATGSPGTTLHTGTAAQTQEIDILACNTDSVDRTLTLQWGGTSSPDDSIVVILHANEGMRVIWSGLIIGALVIRAFASAANVIVCNGRVMELS